MPDYAVVLKLTVADAQSEQAAIDWIEARIGKQISPLVVSVEAFEVDEEGRNRFERGEP